MISQYKTATVFGGTGFVGTQVVRELARRGIRVKVAARVPESAYFLRTCGVVGQVVPLACDYSDDAISRAIAGSDYVVNCTGILFEKRKGDFAKVHTDRPAVMAASCARLGAVRFVHISALGVESAKSKYALSKLEGEKAVLKEFPAATILRPSVIFGEGDSFFNRFARMAALSPALPLIGGGKTKFQPVYVGDVADAVMAALTLPDVGRTSPQGQIYELGGPEILSFREVYERLFAQTGQTRALVTIPWWGAKVLAAFAGMLPNPPLTRDQVESLKTDNVVNSSALGLNDLGLSATALGVILPRYLGLYRPGSDSGENPPAQKAA